MPKVGCRLFEYIVRRIVYGLLILLVMTVFTFVVMRLVPGDVVTLQLAQAGVVSEEQMAALKSEMGLDKPVWQQLLIWLKDALQGDLGTSLWSQQPVMDMIAKRLPVTLELVGLSVIISLLVGIPLGVIAAVKHGKWADQLIRVTAITGLSIPNFWLGLLIITFLSLWFGWIPPIAYRSFLEDPAVNLQKMILPALALAVTLSASTIRMTRSALLEVLHSDFIRTVRAKGASERIVIYKHALRNSLISVVTLVGLQIGILLGGTVVLEYIFSIPGMGSLIFETVSNRDYPVVQACVLIYGGMFILVNLLVDITYGWIDPRIRHQSSNA
ncbi:MAG: glutathione ABC transporter permease GsiC [Bacillus thermozeamaize]|uniref:Nickel import system permease protein NikB n=1 Tax=Bacillus thermozeamaize TaxID=230954 RepID=A0A1Y3PTQ1_9BACI|nr:MAG: glutathione ABC transporter permease GsiC [Bacillus thermozeamaize]